MIATSNAKGGWPAAIARMYDVAMVCYYCFKNRLFVLLVANLCSIRPKTNRGFQWIRFLIHYTFMTKRSNRRRLVLSGFKKELLRCFFFIFITIFLLLQSGSSVAKSHAQ